MEFNNNNFEMDCTVETVIDEKLIVDINRSIEGVFLNFIDSVGMILADFDLNIKFHLSLIICDDSKMKDINEQHRAKNKTTDVLSFPLHENVRGAEFDSVDNNLFLGDILISHQVCLKQASDSNLSYKKEFSHLFSHGLLHLLGYDHEISDSEAKLMFELEDLLVGTLS